MRKSNWAHHFPPRTGQVIVSSFSPKTMKIPNRILTIGMTGGLVSGVVFMGNPSPTFLTFLEKKLEPGEILLMDKILHQLIW